jgi:CHAT domain-containing protein
VERKALIDSRHRRLRRTARLAALGLAALPLACGSAAPPAPPVERVIAAGEARAFGFQLPAGRYLSLAYRQSGLEIEAALTDPHGRPVAEAGRGERRTLKRLSVVTRTAGPYRLTLRARDAIGTRGRFRLEFDELRAAEGDDDLRVRARQAFSQGLRAWDRGDAAGAMAQLVEARSLAHRAHDLRGEIDAENEAGILLFYEPDVPRGYQALDDALAAAQRIGYDAGEAKALAYLGVGDLFLGRPGASVPQRKNSILAESERALDLWKRLGDVAEEGEVASNLGFLNASAAFPSAPAEAARWYGRSLALRRRAGDVDGEANTLNGLGILRQSQNLYDGAETLLLQARELSRRLPDRRLEAQVVGNLASVYQALGELKRALAFYNDPLLTNEKVAPFTWTNRLSNVAALYAELGKPDQALDAYRRVLASQFSGEESLRLHARINMGQVLFQRGDTPAALEQLSRALRESRRLRSPGDEALTLECLGGLYLKERQARTALSYLQPARELRRAAPNRSDEAEVLVKIGSAYRLLGDMGQADRALGEALRLARAGKRQSTRVTCLQTRAAFDLVRGDPESARREAEEAIREIEAERGQVASDDLRISFFSQQRGPFDTEVGALMQLDDRRPGQGLGAAALAASESAHARGLLDLIAQGRIGLRRGASPALHDRQTRLARELAAAGDRRAAALAARPPDAARARRLDSELVAIHQREQELAAEISARSAFVDPKPLGAREIQRLLDDQTALLEYWLGDKLAYLFVVTRGGLAIHRLSRPAAEIEQRVAELRRTLESPSGARLASFRRDAARLYRDLLPAGADAKRNLLIVPDGVLHLLPFEVLLTAEVERATPLARLPYLLATHTVAYVPSASVLRSLRQRPPRARPKGRPLGLLAYAYSGRPPESAIAPPAGPSATGAPGGGGGAAPARGAAGLAPLARVGTEVQAIAALYMPGARALYLEERASRKNVVDNPLVETARRIHFASHGLIDEEHPDLSSLVLAPSGPGDDGKLRMADIFDLKLDADLVVLSACETGLGRQVTGEGLVGFTRAFFYAGARSLAVSLWLVADSSTPDLMRELYSRLERGENKAEALRQAKLAMIAGRRFAHPFYWAPFVLVGDPR